MSFAVCAIAGEASLDQTDSRPAPAPAHRDGGSYRSPDANPPADRDEALAAAPPRLRVLVETDAGGDPDDEGSLVRFLLYANEWDIEGIIADRPRTQTNNAGTGLALVRQIVDAYGKVQPNLARHADGYPTHEQVVAVTVPGYDAVDDAVKLCVKALTADDPRPIWFANWGSNSGTISSMKRALDQIQREKPADEYRKIVGRLRMTRNAEKIQPHTALLPLFVDTRNPDKWYHRFSPLTTAAAGFVAKRDIHAVGPLGALYSGTKEGDSLSFIYLIPTGLSDPSEPTWGCWGGRYLPMDEAAREVRPQAGFYWSTAQDTIDGKTDRDHTLSRWASAMQNDFVARMRWTVTADPKGANHPPLVVVQGDKGRGILRLDAAAGKAVVLDAAGTSDPDRDKLAYRWFVYPEAGTYTGATLIEEAQGPKAHVTVPADAAGKSLHVVLEVTDAGTPPLTRYRRVVFSVR